MGLAERVSRQAWSLTEGWQKLLRELGERGDIIKQIHLAVHGDSSRYRIVREGEALLTGVDAEKQMLVGRVAGKGLSDEMKGRFYAVIETPDGSAYHVPLDAKRAEAVGPGDIVLFGTRPELSVRPMDRHIADKARGGRGIYELDPAGDDADRARASRRLRELEREGFVSARGPDRWSVPTDLIERLENRPRAEPARERLWLQKLPLSLDATPESPGAGLARPSG